MFEWLMGVVKDDLLEKLMVMGVTKK